MARIAKYNNREFIIDELGTASCRVCVIDEKGSGQIYINREDAERAIQTLQGFIESPRYSN